MLDKGHWYLPVNDKLKKQCAPNRNRGRIFFKRFYRTAADYLRERKKLTKVGAKSH